jgi:hypothetical protein
LSKTRNHSESCIDQKMLTDALTEHVTPHLLRENDRVLGIMQDLFDRCNLLDARVSSLENKIECPHCKRAYREGAK